jgi:hypothetical protein
LSFVNAKLRFPLRATKNGNHNFSVSDLKTGCPTVQNSPESAVAYKNIQKVTNLEKGQGFLGQSSPSPQ